VNQKTISYDDYVTINTVNNALDSLETAAQFLARSDNLKWKWAAIALHHSLYSFCIACLEYGNSNRVLSSGRNDDEALFVSKDGETWFKSKRTKRPSSPGYTIEWVPIEKKPPRPTLPNKKDSKPRPKTISFWTALARVQDGFSWMDRRQFRPLILSEDEWIYIEWLAISIRNELIHFSPKTYLLPVAEIQQACSHVLRPIEFLSLESGAIYYLEDVQRRNIQTALLRLREGLGQPASST